MANDIKMRRVTNKLQEVFQNKVDMSDLTMPNDNHFLTHTLAGLALMMKSGLDVDSSCSHITDNYHDMGIDSIYLDESQKMLFLVQSKWRNDGKGGVSQSEMHTFADGVSRIIDMDLDGANQKIIAERDNIEEALTSFGYQIQAVYIHTGDQKVNDYAFRPMKILLDHTNDEDNEILKFDEITLNDIYSYFAKGQGPEEISLDDVMISNWGKISEPYSAYYGTISAATIGEWYQEYGNLLFAKNIRYYKGNTSVNDGMEQVLLHEPENFIFYNNGIKILCKSVKRKLKNATTNETGLFMLEGVSLVNGAQTTGTIGHVYLNHKEQTVKARVMIQIIDLSQATDEAAARITKLSNTQNRIENRDFASLDPVQEKIRQDLSFAHFSYLYKSGDDMTDPSCQLTFDEAIIAMACLNSDISYSATAKRNIGALSEDITKPPYKVLINAGINTNELLNSVMIVRYVDKELRKRKQELSGKERLVTIHGNRFIAYCVLQQLKKDVNFSDKPLYGEQLQNRTYKLVDSLIKPITDSIKEIFPDSYPANIFKNITKCKDIYEKVK
ncbi:AIPR family protein [Hornefia butyriciproducens]|uniref:AIPR family protein n=1 Tax=Hornefia butyriciproducens TaxID=2652293 RepID=UPI002A912C8A|nr:AIPR family protein [Hornefia butyriciproducens]MDY5463720.1 AIPR family protein [Hornefia butyriciproducens]